MRLRLNYRSGLECHGGRLLAGLAGLGWVALGVSPGQDAAAEVGTLEGLTVVGSVEQVWSLAGSAAYLDAEEIRREGFTNVNRVLAKVPGVYVREEDGFGNFPNISLRGADGTRSEKVTVMEDGILTAPAAYSAPAAYYTPRVARMRGVEVLKGSSQVKYGPHTTGGVINYLSTEVPEEFTAYARLTGGSYGTLFGHAYVGDTVEGEAGRFGYLLELHGQTSDGYRDIDYGGDSGFDLLEPMVKLFWEPATALRQRIEVKAGYTDFAADETYLGLTDEDARRRPDRRYAASRFDRFESEHWRTYAKWIAEPSDAVRLESALYYNYFERSWDKLDRVGVGPAGALRELHQSLLNPAAVAVLDGTAVGRVRSTDNLRDYASYGWQNQVNFRFATGEVGHDLAVGLRLHWDDADARQQRDTYAALGGGSFVRTDATAVMPAGLNETFATAVFVEDAIDFGRLTLRPGVRCEWLELDYTSGAGVHSSGDESLLMAGLGGNFELDDDNSLFGGVYQGASSPSPQAYLTTGTDNEESLGWELGWRHRRDHFNAELCGFLTDFDQLISTDAGLGAGGGIPSQNAGEAEVWGFESLVQYDPGRAQGWAVGVPVYLSATWTSAEFKNTSGFLAGGGDAVYAGGADGNEIPYVPEWLLAAGIGVAGEDWRISLDMTYNSTMWGTGYNGNARVDNPATPATNEGTPTSRDGKLDSLLIFDLSGHYQLTEQVRLVGGISNLFDERGIVSRIPEGPRTNAPRMLWAGVEMEW